MIKKTADELVLRLNHIHGEIENIIQDYMNEYACYGWDSTTDELRSLAASTDAIALGLKYAAVEEERYF